MQSGKRIWIQGCARSMKTADIPRFADLEHRLAFETLITDLSARLVTLASSELDQGIEQALERVRLFFQCDRCGLLSLSESRRSVFVTHASYDEGIEHVSGDINLAEVFPWSYEQVVARREPTIVARVRDLPPEAQRDRQSYATWGVRSTLDIPLLVTQKVCYIIVIQSLRTERDWPEEYVPRLRLLGEILVSALERKKADESLRASEERLRLTTESAEIGLWAMDLDTRSVWVSHIARLMFHFDGTEEIHYESLLNTIHPDDRQRVDEAIEQCLSSGGDFRVEHRIVTPAGEIRWITARGRTEHARLGNSKRLMGICIDTTERKRREIETAELRAELTHLSRVMAMSELSTSLAHEINQPLGAILNNASAATILLRQKETRQEEVDEILADIIQDAKRAGDVIRKIRGIVKRTDAQFEPLQMNALVEEVVVLFNTSFNMNKVSLSLHLSPDLAEISGDRIRLQQVLVNLMTNAMAAMELDTLKELSIRTSMETSERVVVSVSDSGKGLPQFSKDRVFEPFFTTKKDGLGMGLRICQSIIGEHDGRIWAEDNPGRGATFSFSLPARRHEGP